jgi:hypothetical protein
MDRHTCRHRVPNSFLDSTSFRSEEQDAANFHCRVSRGHCHDDHDGALRRKHDDLADGRPNSCDTLSGEIASGTIHAIATKPVQRWCLVLGKWVGIVGMLTLYVMLIEGGSIVISWLHSGYLPPHVPIVLSLIWLQALVLLGLP